MESRRLRGQVRVWDCPCSLEPPFVESRIEILDTGMPTTGIVPAFDGIEHNGQEQEPCPGGNVRDIGHPELIRTFGREVPLNQIRSGRRPVGAAAFLVDGSDRLGQLLIFPSSPRRQSAAPRIVPAGEDFQQTAHRGHSMQGLVPLHEFGDLGGIEPGCRANQAAAFAKISRSCRSCRFSRLNLTSSCLSPVVNPSWRRPSSRSACTTQLPIVRTEGSYLRASASGLCPARTISISWLPGFRAYGGLLGIVNLISQKILGLHETGAILDRVVS